MNADEGFFDEKSEQFYEDANICVKEQELIQKEDIRLFLSSSRNKKLFNAKCVRKGKIKYRSIIATIILSKSEKYREWVIDNFYELQGEIIKSILFQPDSVSRRENMYRDLCRYYYQIFWLSPSNLIIYYIIHQNRKDYFNKSNKALIAKQSIEKHESYHGKLINRGNHRCIFEDTMEEKNHRDSLVSDTYTVFQKVMQHCKDNPEKRDTPSPRLEALVKGEYVQLDILLTSTNDDVFHLAALEFARNKEDKVNILLEHLCKSESFISTDNYLYLYEKKNAYYRCLKTPKEEENAIFSLLPDTIQRSLSSSVIKEVLFRLKRLSEIFVSNDFFNIDKNGRFVNCVNGVYDLKNGTFSKHKRKDHQKYAFNYYNKAEYLEEDSPKTEAFDAFIKTSLKYDGARAYLLYIIGDLCTPNVSYKTAFFFVGKPDSGKTKIGGLIKEIIGDHDVSGIALHDLGERFSNSVLSNSRVNINMEMRSTPLRNTAPFKTIVGRDYAEGEFKGKPLYQFHHNCKLLFAGNAMPEPAEIETADAFINKIRFLVFPKSIPSNKQKLDLEEKFRKEKNAIFTCAMRQMHIVYNESNTSDLGLGKLTPKECSDYKEKYRTKINLIPNFIKECCKVDNIGTKNFSVSGNDLYLRFKQYCQEKDIRPPERKSFSRKFGEILGCESHSIKDGVRGFSHVKLKEKNN